MYECLLHGLKDQYSLYMVYEEGNDQMKSRLQTLPSKHDLEDDIVRNIKEQCKIFDKLYMCPY